MAGRRVVNTDEAAEIAASLLGSRMPKHVIRKTLNRHFRWRKGISARSFETILARGRDLLQLETGKSRRELRNQSREVYQGMVGDPDYPPSVKLQAQQSIDKLYRLAIPERVVIAGTGEGGAIKTESNVTHKAEENYRGLPTEKLEQIARWIAESKAKGHAA